MASGFILLALFATIYYYRKRSLYQTDFVHGTTSTKTNDTKILLLQKELKFSNEKPYKIGKTPAVRSPNSTSLGANSGGSNVVINPFQKKSPSPTGGLSREFCFAEKSLEVFENNNVFPLQISK